MSKRGVEPSAVDWMPDPSDEDRKKLRRKREAEIDDTGTPVPEAEDQSRANQREQKPRREPERQPERSAEVAAARSRERVAVREAIAGLPDVARQRFEQLLQLGREQWWLEREGGRRFISRLVRTERIEPAEGRPGIQLTQRIARFREAPPPDPDELRDHVADAIGAEQATDRVLGKLERLRGLLGDKDEVTVRWDSPDGPAAALITAEEVTPVDPEEANQTVPVADTAPSSDEQLKTDRDLPAPDAVQTAAPPEPDEPTARWPESAPLPDAPVPEAVATADIFAETVHGVESEPVVPSDPAERAFVTKTIEALWEEPETDMPPPSGRSGDIAQVIEDMNEYGYLIEPQPRMAGGAPELTAQRTPDIDDQTAESDADLPDAVEEEPEEPEPMEDAEETDQRIPGGAGHIPAPAERDEARPRHRTSRPKRRVQVIEAGWQQPESKPDAQMRKKAHHLVRVLARRYGLRLTPELEANLVAILLKAKNINGRRVHGLGLNREELLQVMAALQLSFGDTYSPRPQV